MASELEITNRTALRRNGDTIFHVCAEYGQVRLFDYFMKNLGGDLDCTNKLLETPFIVAARESRLNVLRFYYEKY